MNGMKMRSKDLKKMNRAELLALLVEQSHKVKELEMKIAELEAQLNSRIIITEEAGNLAEAALKLNGIFEIAQAAADQYLENIIRKTEIEQQRNITNEEKESYNPF